MRFLIYMCLIFLLLGAEGFARTDTPYLEFDTEKTVKVSDVKGLMAAVSQLKSDTTLLLAPGVYDLGREGRSLTIDNVSRVAIRGATGNREDVVLVGQGMGVKNGSCPIIIHINNAQDVLVADMTLKQAWYHLIQVHGESNAQHPYFYNLHLLDCGEQFIKSCCGSDNGVVEHCLFEFTTHARWHYTSGIDVLQGDNWIVRNNIFRNIRGPKGQLTQGAVFFWQGSKNTIVENNEFYECDFGVALGNPAGIRPDHTGGIVRHNIFFRKGAFGDAAVTLIRARDFDVSHNILISNQTFPWVIDFRFPESTGKIAYNLTDGKILSRDGATASLKENITTIKKEWFADFDQGNLNLTPTAKIFLKKKGFDLQKNH